MIKKSFSELYSELLGLSSEVTYSHTNESLETLILGLNLREDSKVLSVLGSGDQIFSMLEFSNTIMAVDINPKQIEYFNLRIRLLKEHDFFFINPNSSYYDEISSYFNDGRIKRILKRLSENQIKLSVVKDDIFSESFLSELREKYSNYFDRVYLSNAIAFSYIHNEKRDSVSFDDYYKNRIFSFKPLIVEGKTFIYTSESSNSITPEDISSELKKMSKSFNPSVYKF